MIQANELRVGNYVASDHFKDRDVIVKVRLIGQEQAIVEHPSGLSEPMLYQGEMRGIKLTEEILLKCGFNYKDGEYVKGLWKLAADYPKEEVVGYGLFIKRLDWTRTNENSITYLHQLQNLFFGITGHELEIKF